MKSTMKSFANKNCFSNVVLVLMLFSISLLFSGQLQAQVSGYCAFPVDANEPPEDEEKEKCEENTACCNMSPCSVAKGNYTASIVDLTIPTRGFPIVVGRRYKSDRSIDGIFGYGWTSNLLSRLTYTTYLYAAPSTYLKQAAIVMPNGGVYRFNENPDGSFMPPVGSFDTLVKNVDGSFDLTLKLSRNKFHYNAQGALISITDGYNNSLSFTYDVGSGRLIQVSDATGSGRSLSFTYNPNGQIELIEDHSGRQIEYQYTSGKMTRMIDAENRNTDYGYVQGRFAPLLSQIKDNWGRVITDITYDGADRVLTYSEAGEVWTYDYQYQNDPHKTSKTGSGNMWVYTFNDDGQVTQIDPPVGGGSASSYISYNSNGLVAYKIDETGVKTTTTYNLNGSIATRILDDGGPETVRFDHSYDPNFPEKVISIIPKDPSTGNPDLDWQGQKFDYYQTGSTAPGALYRVYRVRNDGVNVDTLATFTYNSAGQIETITSATGGLTTYGYNSTTGDLTSITYPKNSTAGSNPVYNYGRDSLGRLTTITNPVGKITTFTYDDLDRVLTVTLPKPQPASLLNFVTTYTYDQYDAGSGFVFTHRTDTNGRITKQGYDQFGQLRKSIDALNNATTFAYNKGLLQSITDANANVTSYSYNGIRQLTATNFAEGLSEIYAYWEDGLLKSKTDRKSQTINYNYDHLKRLTQKSYPNSTSITFTFVGQKLTDANDTFAAETHSFLYDSSYRPSSNTQGTRGTITYTYNPADRVATYSVSGGGPTATYTHYDDGSLKTIEWSPVAGQFTYNYTLNGLYSSIVFPNNQQRNYTFDDQGRLTQITNTHPTPGNLATYDYEYDVDHYTGQATMLGQRTSMNSTVPSQSFNNHQTKYYYDSNYQLTRADYPNVAPFNSEIDQWTYDSIGNRTANIVNSVPQNYAYYINPGNSNNGQRLQSDGTNTYTYDNNGNMITKSGAGGSFTFTYDYENRLIGISGSSTANYTYDYMGRRTSKNVSGTTTFIYNSQDLIGERGVDVADFLFGPSVDEPLSMHRSGSTHYFVNDGLGSINLLNNASGTIQNKYIFDSWGVIRSQTVSIANQFGYTGREFGEASMLFSRARYYAPDIGRFAIADPIRFNGGINWYAYVNNDPTNYIDPSGLKDRQWPVNGEVHNHSKDPVTAVDMDHNTVIDVPPDTNTSNSQDVDFVFIDGKWYKISIWNFDVSETGKPDGGFDEATPKELEDIERVLKQNQRDIEDPSKKTTEKKKC